MKNKLLSVAAVIVIILAAGYFYSNRAGYRDMKQSPKVNVSPDALVVTEGNKIVVSNFAFSPANLTVKQGATVTWVNQDSVQHSIVSSSFSSGLLATGQSFQTVFKEKGVFTYNCGIHPSMKGTITVE